MTHVKELDLQKAIELTKMRIKHHEKHACGSNVMIDKSTLQKQIRKMELKYPEHRKINP